MFFFDCILSTMNHMKSSFNLKKHSIDIYLLDRSSIEKMELNYIITKLSEKLHYWEKIDFVFRCFSRILCFSVCQDMIIHFQTSISQRYNIVSKSESERYWNKHILDEIWKLITTTIFQNVFFCYFHEFKLKKSLIWGLNKRIKSTQIKLC